MMNFFKVLVNQLTINLYKERERERERREGGREGGRERERETKEEGLLCVYVEP